MPAASVFYPARNATLLADTARLSRRDGRWRIALTASLLLVLGLFAALIARNWPAWPILLPAAVAALALYRTLTLRRQLDRLARLLDLYTRALARLDGTTPQTGQTGEEFRSPTHLYDRDLAILGPDSLFGLLGTVRTGVGQRGLARDLLDLHSREATLARQQAVQELAPRNDLREAIHLLGASQFQQVAASFFDQWLDDPPPTFPPTFRPLLILTTLAAFTLLLLGTTHVLAWSAVNPNLLAIFALQAALALYLRSRVLPILNAATNLSNQMQIFRGGLALLQSAAFTSPKLRDLQAQSQQPSEAVSLIAQLQRQLAIVQQRTKGFALVLSLLTCAGTHAALSIAAWKRQYAPAMKRWLAAWAEFESLNAFATYAFEHTANIYPEILSTETAATFEATALAHPLLGPEAVANDIALSPTASIYLISGSNMAGKSTLLRALGLNAVLAAAGAPIRASAARISPLHIGASLALTDSLAEGKSKFLAEVERLHAILQLASAPIPVLFLIDEIFSGTNSFDRRLAAEAVAAALIKRGAIGALSTHDLTLTEMAANPSLHALNLHMASPDPADPLAFDYLLKPGINPSSNALAILRLIGIDLP